MSRSLAARSLAALVLVASLAAFSQPAVSQSVPAGLQGKSAVVSWTENRTQRNVGEERTETVAVPYSYRVYFSGAGRPFARLTVANRRGETASRDRVGAGERSGDGGARSLQMRGNSLVATSGHGGGARRIEIKFDGSSSCSANVILGRSGGQKIVMRNLVSGKQMEILSATTSAASCSLQSGNVFGN
jgi:hypothetical protein